MDKLNKIEDTQNLSGYITAIVFAFSGTAVFLTLWNQYKDFVYLIVGLASFIIMTLLWIRLIIVNRRK